MSDGPKDSRSSSSSSSSSTSSRQCANCKHYNSMSQLCCCTKAAHYGYKITVSASSPLWACDHYSYKCNYPSSKPSRRKLLLLDD